MTRRAPPAARPPVTDRISRLRQRIRTEFRSWGILAGYRRTDLPPTDAEVMAHPKVAALVEAAEWFERGRQDALVRAEVISAPEDAAVRALCEKHGYGAVMDSAARLWAQKDGRSAFFIGGCVGDTSVHAALAAMKGDG